MLRHLALYRDNITVAGGNQRLKAAVVHCILRNVHC